MMAGACARHVRRQQWRGREVCDEELAGAHEDKEAAAGEDTRELEGTGREVKARIGTAVAGVRLCLDGDGSGRRDVEVRDVEVRLGGLAHGG
jgi:hypothetical protein